MSTVLWPVSGWSGADAPVDVPAVERSVADVAERLMAEYGGPIPLVTISATVLAAARDLADEVPRAAFAEMLYRLARQRLTSDAGR